MSTAASLVYLSSVRVSEAPEGMFARILKHNVTGHRYTPPEKPEPRDKRKARPAAPAPYSARGYAFAREHAKANAQPKKPRWTAERVAAMPRQSGSLTRTSDPYAEPAARSLRGASVDTARWFVRAKCSCGEGVRVERARWMSPTCCPKSCRACSAKSARAALAIVRERKVAVR